jgi:poly(3-hydroxybutyrate) depolymerase
MKRIFATATHAVLAAIVASAMPALAQSAALPKLKIDPAQTSVSGISSGGYMAAQLHVAHSSRFPLGMAGIASGPYDCAEGSVLNAIGRCLGNADIPVEALVALTQKRAKDGLIDPIQNLAKARVYVFSGSKDTVVKPTAGQALAKYYAAIAPTATIAQKSDVPAEHAFITDGPGAECTTKAVPWLNNCGFDLAGAVLGHLYGKLDPRTEKATGTLHEIAQADDKLPSLDSKAWVYVPKSCAEGATCRLHVALHGCRHNALTVNESFVRDAGYNRWADSNRLVVLYPQTGKAAVNACWDWWGYSSPDYATKKSPQMQAILGMMDRLSGPSGNPAK